MSDFFDNFGKGSDKFFSEIENKFYEIADSTGTKIDIMHLSRKRDKELMDLGVRVYKMYLKHKFEIEDIEEECSSILKLDERIKEIQDGAREKKKERKGKN